MNNKSIKESFSEISSIKTSTVINSVWRAITIAAILFTIALLVFGNINSNGYAFFSVMLVIELIELKKKYIKRLITMIIRFIFIEK